MSTSPTLYFRALGDDTRWRIIQLVMRDALCICELADILDMPQSTLSSHVQIIRKAGLLESEQCGKWTYFRILPSHLPLLRHITENLRNHSHYSIDLEKAQARLLHRESSCCPRPIHLTKKICNSTI